MKKLIILTLCLCIPFTFIGCYNKTDKNDENIIIYPDDEAAQTLGGYRQESEENNSLPSGSTYYVGNLNSKKFHVSSCDSANKMKEENKIIANDRQALIDKGYTPCSVCKP